MIKLTRRKHPKSEPANFWDRWKEIQTFLANKMIFVFLDYDGTLTPIVDRPDQAQLSKGARKTLEALAGEDRCRVAIVTGRSLIDIVDLVGLKKLTYVGNHGFEIQGPQVKFENLYFPECRKTFKKITDEIQAKFGEDTGVIIENKGATVSIHYRLLAPDKLQSFQKFVDSAVGPYVKAKALKFRQGKMVYELWPNIEWNKGYAVHWLLKRYQEDFDNQNTAVVYMGDDRTDEDAFAVLQDNAITVKVGKDPATMAKYYVDGVEDVESLLMKLILIKKFDKKDAGEPGHLVE